MTTQTAQNRILVLGVGPLPIDRETRLFAPGLRTWNFAQTIEFAGHSVCVGVIDFGATEEQNTQEQSACFETAIHDDIMIYRLKFAPEQIVNFITQQHSTAPFDAIVSTTDIMNAIASRLTFRVPLWLDYNGDPFAEKQLMGEVHGNDATLLDQWELFFEGLRYGDRFSTCSPHQTHALLGQLGFAGRLNQHTANETLVCDLYAASQAMAAVAATEVPQLRGTVLPGNAFIVFWMGGYNTWSDVEMLFKGVEKAMRIDDTIWYVSTGGALDGHNSVSFLGFQKMIQSSDYKDRFYFTGWIPTNEVPSYLKQADLTICIDRPSAESELGYRTRVMDWLLAGIPVVSTAESFLTQTLAKIGAIYPVSAKNPTALCDAILLAKNDKNLFLAQTTTAISWFRENFTDYRHMRPLIDWVNTPVFAGDRSQSNVTTYLDGVALQHQQPYPPRAPFAIRAMRKLKRMFRRLLKR